MQLAWQSCSFVSLWLWAFQLDKQSDAKRFFGPMSREFLAKVDSNWEQDSRKKQKPQGCADSALRYRAGGLN
jgi:hypothetical protein